MSAACTGRSELMRTWLKCGCAESPSVVVASIIDQSAVVVLKLGSSEPYQPSATRPGSPTAMAGKTLLPSPPESTWCGALQVAPWSDDVTRYRWVSVAPLRRSEKSA